MLFYFHKCSWQVRILLEVKLGNNILLKVVPELLYCLEYNSSCFLILLRMLIVNRLFLFNACVFIILLGAINETYFVLPVLTPFFSRTQCRFESLYQWSPSVILVVSYQTVHVSVGFHFLFNPLPYIFFYLFQTMSLILLLDVSGTCLDCFLIVYILKLRYFMISWFGICL